MIFALFYTQKKLSAIILTLITAGMISMHIRVQSLQQETITYPKEFIKITGIITDVKSNSELVNNITLSQIDYTHDNTHIKYQLPTKVKIIIPSSLKHTQFTQGDSLVCSVKLKPIKPKQTPTDFDARFYNFFQGIQCYGELDDRNFTIIPYSTGSSIWSDINVTFIQIRVYLMRYFNQLNEHAGIAQALILGNRSNLNQDTQSQFKQLGIYHILSISGLHLSIILAMFLLIGQIIALLAYFILRAHNLRLYSKLFAISMCILYSFLTGGSIPTIRSLLMYSIALLIWLQDRHVPSMMILSTTCSIILLIMPESLFMPGFQFSFTAMFCILSTNISYAKTWRQKILNIIRLCGRISLYTAPLSIYHFQTLTLQPFLANLIIVPYISTIVIPSLFISLLEACLTGTTFTLSILHYQFEVLQYLINALSYFALTISWHEIYLSALYIFILSLPLVYSNTLKRYHYIGTICSYIILCIPAAKPLILIDSYGRIGYIDRNILYVSFNPESKLAQKWQKYYNTQEIQRFKHKPSQAIHGYTLGGPQHDINLKDCYRNEGLAVYRYYISYINRTIA